MKLNRCFVFVVYIAAASSACREARPSGLVAVANAATTAVQAPTTRRSPPARVDLMGPTAALLVELGGRYLCDQRIYLAPGGPHISAWEWAFPDDPQVLTETLAKRLTDADREGATFRWKRADGSVEAALSVEDVSKKSRLDCGNIPASTKSFVVASQL